MVSFVVCMRRCVGHLLMNNASPNRRDKDGFSPVHFAACNGHTLALQMVICFV